MDLIRSSFPWATFVPGICRDRDLHTKLVLPTACSNKFVEGCTEQAMQPTKHAQRGGRRLGRDTLGAA